MNNDYNDLVNRIQALESKLQMLIQPSQQVSITNESGGTSTAQLSHVAGCQSPSVPLSQTYGFWSRPLAGSMHTVL